MDARSNAVMVSAIILVLVTGTLAAMGPGQANAMQGQGPMANTTDSQGQGNSEAVKTKSMVESRQQLRVCMQDAEDRQDKKECITQVRNQNREQVLTRMSNRCDQIEDSARQSNCQRRVNALGACWAEEPGLDRAECAKEQLGLQERVRTQVQTCRDSQNTSECINEVKARVYNYVSLRFQGLAERAQELLDRGVGEETVADFVANLGELEEKFDSAETIDEKKEIFEDVRAEWKSFIEEARAELQNGAE